MSGKGRRFSATVRLMAVVAAVSGIALGGLAATTLLEGSDDRVVASGELGDGAGVDTGTAHSPVTIPVPVGEAPAPVVPVAGVTPGKNPPLMAKGTSSEQVRELQARLTKLDLFDGDPTGYFGDVTAGAVVAYQEAKGVEASGEVYPQLWAQLQGETPQPTEDELYPPPPVAPPPTIDAAGLDSRCLTGRAMCIDKASNRLFWVVDGRVLLQLDARFGSDELPTREGAFSVFHKKRDAVSNLYHTAMPFAMFFSGGQAVHYSPDFAAHGYSGASHGCVNLRDYDAVAWLYDQVNYGDKVIVYWS